MIILIIKLHIANRERIYKRGKAEVVKERKWEVKETIIK